MKRFLLLVLVLSAACFSQEAPGYYGNAQGMSTSQTVPYVGPPYYAHPYYDPDSIYNDSTGLNLSSKNYLPKCSVIGCFRGIMIYGSGNISVWWANGNRQVIPISVPSGDFVVLTGFFQSIRKQSTTCTGIHPLW